jgi:PAS domain S-box-containing protein
MGAEELDVGLLTSELLDGVFACSKSGEIMFSNPAFARMLGFRHEAMKAKNIAKDIVERDLEWRALVSLLEQGSPIHDYEIKFRRSDGMVMIISLTANALLDGNGSPIGIAAVARDISTRKGVENELREKAFRIDVMNRIAKLAGTHKDIRTVLLKVSEELQKLLDFDSICAGVTEEKGRHVEVFVPDPKHADKAVSLGKVLYEGSIVEKLRFGGKAVIVEKEAGRKLFSEFGVLDVNKASSMMAVPLTSRGRVLGSLNLLDSKQAEYDWESAEALQMVADLLAGMIDNMVLFATLETKMSLQEALVRSSVELQRAISTEQIYAAISSHIMEVVRYKDLSFYVVDWQKKLVQPVYAVGGYSDEILGDPGGFDEGIVGLVAKTGKAEFVDDVDADPRSADIPGIPLEHNSMLAIPLTGSHEVIGVLELYRERGQVFTQNDLEAGMLFAQQASIALENSQLVAKLQDAKKEIEMLNDLMFHDISNYNFATLNYVEMVYKDNDLPHGAKAPLEKSLHLIRENAKLIENVKKLTKIGVMDPDDFVLVNLSDVLRKIASGVVTSSTKRVGVKLDVPEEAYIKANPLVDELFVNLLNNAVKYDPHEEVDIDVEVKKVLEEDHPSWKVCISDNGYGIPDDKKAMLFQKYVRLKPDTKISGSGLGLSICRALTDKFSGRIWVEDRVQGKSELGARFCVVFPAERHPHQ